VVTGHRCDTRHHGPASAGCLDGVKNVLIRRCRCVCLVGPLALDGVPNMPIALWPDPGSFPCQRTGGRQALEDDRVRGLP
jgi:hypothetical protein